MLFGKLELKIMLIDDLPMMSNYRIEEIFEIILKDYSGFTNEYVLNKIEVIDENLFLLNKENHRQLYSALNNFFFKKKPSELVEEIKAKSPSWIRICSLTKKTMI
ncbi:hypothetical protein [Flagellimonas sp. C4]|uniref:hypothetical protein n=1 Tax=Flagellimonas alginolytica TaxID=3177515 RepID=UPI0035C9394A